MTTDEVIEDINREVTQRFSAAPWFDKVKDLKIAIIGLGGIGSYAAYALSRFRPERITLVDMDIIEAVNLSGQMYKRSDMGLFKTEALSFLLGEFSQYSADTRSVRIQDASGLINEHDIIVCGFDDMDARKYVWDVFRSSGSKLLIDGRMNAEFYQLICVDKDNISAINRYGTDWLFRNEEAEQTICSFKQTSFVGMQIGGMIGSLVANYAYNLCENPIARPVPFLTEFNSASMYLNIEE